MPSYSITLLSCSLINTHRHTHTHIHTHTHTQTHTHAHTHTHTISVGGQQASIHGRRNCSTHRRREPLSDSVGESSRRSSYMLLGFSHCFLCTGMSWNWDASSLACSRADPGLTIPAFARLMIVLCSSSPPTCRQHRSEGRTDLTSVGCTDD